MSKIRYGSRKFIALSAGVFLNILIPIIYSLCGIGESVMIAVIATISGSIAAYTGFNVWSKKNGNVGKTF